MTTLKSLREESKKSRAEVAAALGIAVRTLSHYECGSRRIGLEQILGLSKLYECSERDVIEAQLNSCQCVR